MKAFIRVITKSTPFNKILKGLKESEIRNQVYEDPRITLERFANGIKETKNSFLLADLMEKSGHKEFIDSFVQYAILKTELKTGSIWLWGCPNSGKKTILRMLGRIFTLVPFTQTQPRFDVMYNQSNAAPQFTTLTGGAHNAFFADRQS